MAERAEPVSPGRPRRRPADAAHDETAVPFRGRGFQPQPRRLVPLAVFACLIGAWQFASVCGWLPELFLPSPWQIVQALIAMIDAGTLDKHVSASLARVGMGWLLGSIAGLAIGLAMGIFSVARAAGLPVVSALFPIPKIALLPLFILWFGTGEQSKVATIGFGVFFPTVIAAYAACDSVPRNLIRMGQSFGLPAPAIVWKILLPGAMPGILAGFRITASIALILVVAAEMIGAQFGIGAFILSAGNLNLMEQLLAGVTLLSLLGLAVSAMLSVVERVVLRWR